jgi:hypothetical protein
MLFRPYLWTTMVDAMAHTRVLVSYFRAPNAQEECEGTNCTIRFAAAHVDCNDLGGYGSRTFRFRDCARTV